MNPNNAQFVDELREGLYDTYVAAKSTALPTQIQMFVTPKGPTNGIEITNLTAPGTNGLPNPEKLDVYKVIVNFSAVAIADLTAFCQAYVGRLVLSGFPKLTMPLNLKQELGDATKGSSASNTISFDLPEDYKVSIEQGQPFYFEFISRLGYTLTDGTLGIRARVTLDGLHTVAAAVA